ncbi:MAG: DUF669 domain-containing protein [Lysobacteraceae bacterium]
MAFLGNPFNPNDVPPAEDFTPLPSGEYPAVIVDSDMKPTKAGTGQYLELHFQIIDGPCKGRQVWGRLNLDNPNPKAVEIAQRDLSAICHALGITQAITDSAVLHGRPLVIRVEYREGTGQYGPSNEIKAYKRLEGVPPQPVPQQYAAPPAGAVPPSPFAQPQAYAQPAAPQPQQAPAWAKPAA